MSRLPPHPAFQETQVLDELERPARPAWPDTVNPGALSRALERPVRPVRPVRPSLCCVVPAYNEAENLAVLLPKLSAFLSDCSDDWQVMVVDDGSTDSSALLLAMWAQRSGFTVLQLSRNFGKEAALSAGLEAANGEVVVLMDADLQHPPALIASFIEHWRRGADVVYAVRQERSDEATFKRWGTRAFYALVNTDDRYRVPPGAGDFRLMDMKVVQALRALPERNRFMKGLYAWVGFDAVAVPYLPEPRAFGRSHFSPMRLIRLSLDGLTAFTTWPLRVVSAVGVLLAAFALVCGVYFTAKYLIYGSDVSGWTTIVVSMMLFAGIQLVSLGVVGEYVSRIFEEVKGRPLYIVKQRLGRDLSKADT